MGAEDRFKKGDITEDICKHFCELYGFAMVKNPRDPIIGYNEDFSAVWPDKRQSFIEVKSAFWIARDPYYYYLNHDTYVFIVVKDNIYYAHITGIKFRESDDKIWYKNKHLYVPHEKGDKDIDWSAPRLFENEEMLECYKKQHKKSGDDYSWISKKETNFEKLITADKLDEYKEFYNEKMKNI